MTSGLVDDDDAPGWRRADQVRQRARARLRLLHNADPSAAHEAAASDGSTIVAGQVSLADVSPEARGEVDGLQDDGPRADGAAPEETSSDRAPGGGATERSQPTGGWVPEPVAQRGWAARLSSSGAWGSLAEKWVPEPLRHARTSPQKFGALAIIAVAVLAAAATALVMYWTRPQPIPVTPGMAPAEAHQDIADHASLEATVGAGTEPDDVSPGGASPDGSGQADTVTDRAAADDSVADGSALVGGDQQPGQRSPGSVTDTPLVISVTGLVRRPGLVTVPAGARVADAIAAAGGVDDDALLTGINLAARLADGMSIVISGPGEGHVSADPSGSDTALPSADGSAAGGPININTADASTLEQLPGVGPVTAAAIVTYRTEHGAFQEIAQLQEVSGIGPATFARLADMVTT